MKEKIIKTAFIVAIMAAAGFFYLRSTEGEEISSLRVRTLSGQENSGLSETEESEIVFTETAETSETAEISEMAETAETAETSETAETADDGKININTADARTLQTLSGIGEVKARAIIEYRQTNGKFETIEEIKNVNGIGDATFAKVRDRIKV